MSAVGVDPVSTYRSIICFSAGRWFGHRRRGCPFCSASRHFHGDCFDRRFGDRLCRHCGYRSSDYRWFLPCSSPPFSLASIASGGHYPSQSSRSSFSRVRCNSVLRVRNAPDSSIGCPSVNRCAWRSHQKASNSGRRGDAPRSKFGLLRLRCRICPCARFANSRTVSSGSFLESQNRVLCARPPGLTRNAVTACT